MDYELDQIKKNNLYRELRNVSVKGSKISVRGKTLVNLCSNDYLGLPTVNFKVKQMQSSSRLVSGNDELYHILEKKLAKHKSQQASLIYPTGYMANIGAITAIAKKPDLILSDELNHASIIDACKLTGAKISVYKHNDMNDLQQKIKKKSQNKFVITEGVFSMDGDLAQLSEITEIAQKQNAITILDDAHGDFVMGKDGKGTADHLGVSKKIDVYISSLSKGLGSFGGYVASQKSVIDLNINTSKSFIYTSALPTFLIEYSLNRFESNREKYRKKLQKNIQLFLSGLKKIGYNINSKTHIIPIIISNEKTCMGFGEHLLKNGVYVKPIRYPTVPKNQARLRLSVTALLSKQDIKNSLRALETAQEKFLK